MTRPDQSVDQLAAHWTVRVETGRLPAAERCELERWLAADPRHRGAFVRARAVWRDLDRFASLAGGRTAGNIRAEGGPARSRFHDRRWFLAASVAAITLTGAGTWLAFQSRGETYVSVTGEQRRVPLPDRSNMLLNTATEVVVILDESRRNVELVRGEALFEVARDPSRPFVVQARDVTVKAIGTAFAVRAYEQRVEVTVTEGVVEIAQNDGPPNLAPVRVTAHQRAIATGSGPVQVRDIEPEEMKRRLAWRGGMVAFDGQSLREAVAEINRHSRRRIVVTDAVLAARPVVGIFRASDVETFAEAAAAALGAEAVQDGDVIRLERRSDD